ncbi:MAG: MFS transporter [Alphaproteobacteria bacterium]|jgi:MFS family permease|nr:MFS transporter [Rhodospirillaceae bacterium]MDP6403788.1 MFS transporter [Alphaproteobacteria bacterium]MDP6620635.1 MFS transporter [Alphaproteobacteria bacterium]|tara:strand:- start:1102 stop:2328 length:1227 start_codon:yes stop_codon:yes gene_type:complete
MPPARAQGTTLVVIMCLTQATGLLGMGVLPALLPGFIAEWSLSGTQAGWLNGVFFGGYMASVIVLVSLTDRIDARLVVLGATALSFLSMLAFGLLAEGFWSALALRALHGVGFAGSYMPGLKVLTDRLEAKDPSRGVAFYTASYAIGGALSFYFAGKIDALWGWPAAFALLSLGGLVAFLLVWLGTAPKPVVHDHEAPLLLDFRPVFRNRAAVGYMLAYATHTTELMAAMSWTVAFLTFAASLQPTAALGWSVTLIGAVATIVGLPASVLGNEGARRFGRRRFISVVMVVSAACGACIGFSATLWFPLVAGICILYSALIAADSASLTAGTVMAAKPEQRGATMAVHSFVGFGGGFMGPLAFGAMLDLAGGADVVASWGVAFAIVALVTLAGPFFLARFSGEDEVKGS